ncbi:tyrosine-protein kinase SYK [Aphelenchoides avenae]|nr:tyrosine-protein kinase SYK [Aphelenchus avenae]
MAKPCCRTRRWLRNVFHFMQLQQFSEKSDVWAFGVTVWEIFTRSEPFKHMKWHEVHDFLNDGKRLDIPSSCPPEVNDLLRLCWMHDPTERPTFLELKSVVSDIFIVYRECRDFIEIDCEALESSE